MLDNILVGWQIMHRMKEDPADGCRVRHYGSFRLTPGALHKGAWHTGLRLLLRAFFAGATRIGDGLARARAADEILEHLSRCVVPGQGEATGHVLFS